MKKFPKKKFAREPLHFSSAWPDDVITGVTDHKIAKTH